MFYESVHPPHLVKYDDGVRVVVLMRSSPKDAEAVNDSVHASLPELQRYMPWSHFPEKLTTASQQDRLEGMTRHWDDLSDFVYHIFVQKPDEKLRFCGCLGMHPRCLHNQAVEIGYWIRTDEAGKGLCTLATKMAVVVGFETMGLLRVQIGCDRANMASRRVIEKVGFHQEGLLRNMSHGDAPARILEKGWRGTGDILLYSLIPTDVCKLTWWGSLLQHLTFEEDPLE